MKCMLQHGLDAGEDEETVLDRTTQGDSPARRPRPAGALGESLLARGTRLGAFEIEGRLGAGGQGDVYQAHDSRLGRDVAIKILPSEFLNEPERLVRFDREARILASLNHPNIGALYDLREEDKRRFLVLELVEGKTLSARIAQGPIPIPEALRIGIQIAEALEAAHERGIIHRDLKPANIMLNEKGDVKVLDFGIAKSRRMQPSQASDMAIYPSAADSDTNVDGRVLGTPAYMAPEQRLGKAVDRRTDIWAFGVVLHELLTGQSLPQRALNASAEEGPHPRPRLCPDVSPNVAGMLGQMLCTNPDDRYQNMADALVNLRALLADVESGHRQDKDKPHAEPSIAILPFINIGGETENEYFSDGLAEELIGGLSKLPGLRVIARSSAFMFRGRDIDIRDAGRQLGASGVLEGSVRRAGERLRVTVNLIAIEDGCHLWSESFDRRMDDVFAIQEEIAMAIVEHVRSGILAEEKSRLSMRHTQSLEAHDLYLKGRYHLNSISFTRLTKAIDFFRLALLEDPGYALAYAGLTEGYCLLGLLGLMDPKEAMPEAKAAGLKAVALDETLAEVHHALGLVAAFSGEWPVARMEFQRAIELKPDHAMGRACYAMFLRFTANRDQALVEMRRALELEPHSVAVNAGAAYLFYSLRLYDEAIRQSQKTLALEPGFFPAHGYLAFAYARRGMLNESIAEWRALLSERGFKRAAWGVLRAFERSGYEVAIKGIAQRSVWVYYLVRALRWMPRGRRRFCTPILPAVLYAEAGERDLAIRWLNKACAQRAPLMIGLSEDPPWDGLRSDPRFDEIIRKTASNQLQGNGSL